MQSTNKIHIRIIDKPERKVIIKRGVKATEYWSYCYEIFNIFDFFIDKKFEYFRKFFLDIKIFLDI